jgi:selenide,water dikinase
MKRLNKTASELAVEFGLSCATDITGFGLLGHAMELANASHVRVKLDYPRLPFLAGARRYASEYIFPGGSYDNLHYYQPRVEFPESLSEADRLLISDAQTSGGLLLCVPEEKLPALLSRAGELEQPLWVVGKIEAGQGIRIV